MAATIGGNHRPLRDLVLQELRQRIIEGVYDAGDRLIEDRIAADLGVSRNPVREAMRVLETEGFLVTQPRRGAIVARFSVQDVHDVFDVRLALEGLAARLAAERAGAPEVARLDQILCDARQATEEQRLADLTMLNTRFHAAICELSGNSLLAAMMDALHGRVQWIFRQGAAQRAPHSWSEHVAVLDAIRTGDPDRAQVAAERHVAAARAAAEEFVAQA